MPSGGLDGFTVGVTADRRWQEQAQLLARWGARVLHGPVIRTHPVEPGPELRDALASLARQPPDVVVLSTGIGVRGLIAVAESLGMDHQLLDGMARALVLARGPKAAGAAVAAGLQDVWQAPRERSGDVLHHLSRHEVAGRRVAVQLDGGPHSPVVHELRRRGAEVVPLRVYRWSLPEDSGPAARLLDAVCARRVDAVTFTTAPAVENLVLLAQEAGRRGDLVAALNGVVLAACVGPVTAEAAIAAGVSHPLVPARARLGSLVRAVTAALEARVRRFTANGVAVRLAGGQLTVGSGVFELGARERRVLEALAEQPGVVLSKAALVERAWDGRADEHAVEVAVARVRRHLGPAAAALETVPRRGYRLATA